MVWNNVPNTAALQKSTLVRMDIYLSHLIILLKFDYISQSLAIHVLHGPPLLYILRNPLLRLL